MKKSVVVRKLRKFHKWPGVIISFFVILFAFSGIVMNHRGLVSPVSVSRKLLPPDYHYKNWNLAAVRGSVNLDSTTAFMYGNIGVWKTTDSYHSFSDFNAGFPKGIDNKKIYSIANWDNQLVAGTHMGLYTSSTGVAKWKEIPLPVEKKRVADVVLKNDTLLILTRHYLLKSTDLQHFEKVQLPAPVGYVKEIGLFNTLWELHSGELFGLIGKLVVDLFGAVVILLSVTGLLHFFFPKIIKKRKAKQKSVTSLVSVKKKNLKWHNVVGYIFVLFLIINTISGMHLRPPLLIAIANAKVGIIPYTHLDSPNPWFDKLRRVTWDDEIGAYIFSTSDGFFFGDERLEKPLKPIPNQPPVSVMGCNVLEKAAPGKYLVGSFSGLFVWDLTRLKSFDFFTGQPYQKPSGMSRPIADNMVAGWVNPHGKAPTWFDYNRGAMGITPAQIDFPEMSQEILERSPMSLWNLALEIHTGRIFEHLMGPFYILYVPLAGICILIVLISGFFIWWMGYRKKK